MLSRPIIETFILEENENKNITLTAYVASAIDEMPYNYKRPAVIICPGGGYRFVSNREGEPVALAFLAAGINAFVLDYSVTGDGGTKTFPAQLIELATAIKFVKDNAEKFSIDPDKIFVNGYSAGAHLAASLGTLHSSSYVKDALGVSDNELRPAGMILAYPVITSGEKAHRGSFDNLLGDKATDADALRAVSLEFQVTKETSPAFIWHTRTDSTVPVQNSLLLASALADNGIPFEMHVYPEGPHGMSIATEVVYSKVVSCVDPYVAEWFNAAVRWIKNI
jgi:acetyl esterase/lipase